MLRRKHQEEQRRASDRKKDVRYRHAIERRPSAKQKRKKKIESEETSWTEADKEKAANEFKTAVDWELSRR